MTNVKILWVDDDKSHEDDVKNLLHKNKNLKIDFIHPQNLTEHLKDIGRSHVPDLFLVDFFLNLKKEQDQKYPHKGLVAATEIREKFPEHPIYGISQVGKDKKFSFAESTLGRKQVFDDFLEYKIIQREGHNILYFDAKDYNLIKNITRKKIGELLGLLKAPEETYDTLKKILPEELKEGLMPPKGLTNPEGNAIAFARWVKRFFLPTSGILYDELHTAIYLGIDQEYFAREVSSKFDRARYKGIFHQTTKPLWWVNKINDRLFSTATAREMDTTNPWEIAPAIFKVPKDKMTKCAVCEGNYPETIGVNLENEEELEPVHYRCSVSHPTKRREIYFDEPRGFRYSD